MLAQPVTKCSSFQPCPQQSAKQDSCCQSQMKKMADLYMAEQWGAGKAKPGRKTDFSQPFINTKQLP